MKSIFKYLAISLLVFGCVFESNAQPNNISRTFISATSLLAGVTGTGAFDSMAVRNYVKRVHNSLLYGDGNLLNGSAVGALYYNPTSGKWRVYSPNCVNCFPANFPDVYDSTRWYDLVLGGAGGASLTAPRVPFSNGSPAQLIDDPDFTFTGGNRLNIGAATGGTIVIGSANLMTLGNTSLTATTNYGINVTGNLTHTVSGDFDVSGVTGNNLKLNRTITAGGTTGAQTINKAAGCVNFAAAASTLVVTNSLVGVDSIIFGTVETDDATALLKNIIPAAGSFTIRLNAAATAETRVCFLVTN